MRTVWLVSLLLLAGCVGDKDDGSKDAPTEAMDDAGTGTTDGSTTVAPVASGDGAVNVTTEELHRDDYEVKGSLSTGMESPPWTMGIRTDFDIPDDPAFTGILLEVYWGAETGGVVGGTVGYWANDMPDDGVEATTIAVAEAKGLERGRAWVSAEALAGAAQPQFTVAAADGPNHAVYGTADVVATAFFHGAPDEAFTALDTD